MNNITKETRKESYKKIQLKKKTKLIYEQLDGEMTARELAKKLYKMNEIETPTRQETAPRLTELVGMGLIEVIKKKYDEKSKCNVAVYKKVSDMNYEQ